MLCCADSSTNEEQGTHSHVLLHFTQPVCLQESLLITSQWEFLSLAEEDGDSLVSVCLYMASEEYVSKLDVVQNKSNLLSLSVSVTL